MRLDHAHAFHFGCHRVLAILAERFWTVDHNRAEVELSVEPVLGLRHFSELVLHSVLDVLPVDGQIVVAVRAHVFVIEAERVQYLMHSAADVVTSVA